MVGLDIISQCKKILQDIADLRNQLETAKSEKEKKEINKKINAKERQYDDLQCGAIDPPDDHGGEIEAGN